MNWYLIVFSVLFLIQGYEQISTVDSDSYVAAVVEFTQTNIGATPEDKLNHRVDEYVAFIKSEAAADVDIMVFPEVALNGQSTAQFVPDPSDQVVPCLDASYGNNPIQAISCAARNRTMYVVINMTSKRLSQGDVLLYNTNVVFDRAGKVISIYRKFNLFGESGISTTPTSDMGTFETDFGVEFGHFICFDIAFGTPANDLIRRGITNYAFPTMWFSEIPFLSAVQVQQGWSFSHNVNLLAAGGNRAAVGSSGTGIYAGRQGAMKAIMTDVAESIMLVSSIKKVPGTNVFTNDLSASELTPPIKLKQDYSITNYQFIPMIPSWINDMERCTNGICCSVSFGMQANEVLLDYVHYTYFLAHYDGRRSYDGLGEGHIRFCAVVACTSDDHMSCGKVFPSDARVQQRYVFTHLRVKGTFRASGQRLSVTMPSTLSSNLLPLAVDSFTFNDTVADGDNQLVEITLNEPQRSYRLLTFGIYSHDFSGSGRPIGSLVMAIFLSIGLTMFL